MRVIGMLSRTRRQIITDLRKNEGLSVNQLAEKAEISSMGIRQHLSYLEKVGLIRKEQRHQPIGRPCAYYRLSEDAEELFPKLYARFAAGILGDITEHEGKEKLELIFKWRCQRNWQKFNDFINQPKLVDRAEALVKLMNDTGMSFGFKLNDRELTISTFNCPFYEIAKVYPQLCRYERELFSSLLKIDLKQKQSFPQGDHCCELSATN